MAHEAEGSEGSTGQMRGRGFAVGVRGARLGRGGATRRRWGVKKVPVPFSWSVEETRASRLYYGARAKLAAFKFGHLPALWCLEPHRQFFKIFAGLN